MNLESEKLDLAFYDGPTPLCMVMKLLRKHLASERSNRGIIVLHLTQCILSLYQTHSESQFLLFFLNLTGGLQSGNYSLHF